VSAARPLLGQRSADGPVMLEFVSMWLLNGLFAVPWWMHAVSAFGYEPLDKKPMCPRWHVDKVPVRG